MAKEKRIPRHEGEQIILHALKENTQHPEVPEGVFETPIGEITSMVSVFQPRELRGQHADSEDHIHQLAKTINAGNPWKPLDPMLIWWGGDRWYVIDGHHRRLAYFKAFQKLHDDKKLSGSVKSQRVPVEVFRGELFEAKLEATKRNSKNKLQMTVKDKMNAAWRLVVEGLPAKKIKQVEIADMFGITDRAVRNMRKAHEFLLENPEVIPSAPGNTPTPYDWEEPTKEQRAEKLRADLMELRWSEVRRLVKGQRIERQEDDEEERLRQQAGVMSKRMYHAFGATLAANPEITARALEFYSEKLPAALIRSQGWEELVSALIGIEDPEENTEE